MKKRISAIFFLIFLCALVSCNTLRIQKCLPIYAMDTMIEITFYNVDDYENHYKKVKEIYQDYDKVSSDFTSNEEKNSVYDLNEKRSVPLNPLLSDLINKAIELKEDTSGYYNPFIGRLSRLWKDAIQNKEVLEDMVITEELNKMNHTDIEIMDNVLSLKGEANLDLGGIAKGFATQKVYEYLKEEKVDSFLLNAGNSNILFGSKLGKAFRIGLEKPYDNSLIMIVEDKNKAIGTSSGKYQYTVIENERYHHLINPFTGYPSNIYDSVNVMCEDSILCDVYSTAIFSMNIEEATSFCQKKKVDILLYKENDIIFKTDGWNSYA